MNKKDYKGYELIKAISDKEIKDKTKIEVHSLKVLDITIAVIEYSNKRLEWGTGEFDTSYLFDDNIYFRVLEDNTEEIEELECEESKMYCDTQLIESTKTAKQEDIIDKINELVKAVNEIRKDKNND